MKGVRCWEVPFTAMCHDYQELASASPDRGLSGLCTVVLQLGRGMGVLPECNGRASPSAPASASFHTWSVLGLFICIWCPPWAFLLQMVQCTKLTLLLWCRERWFLWVTSKQGRQFCSGKPGTHHLRKLSMYSHSLQPWRRGDKAYRKAFPAGNARSSLYHF